MEATPEVNLFQNMSGLDLIISVFAVNNLRSSCSFTHPGKSKVSSLRKALITTNSGKQIIKR